MWYAWLSFVATGVTMFCSRANVHQGLQVTELTSDSAFATENIESRLLELSDLLGQVRAKSNTTGCTKRYTTA